MQHFYDGAIRRYITQTIRVFSNFSVRYGDGTLVRIPVLYGDGDRQAAAVVRQNTENKINCVPRISIYVSGLSLDRSRTMDSTNVGRVNIREREYDPVTKQYTSQLGKSYTVERPAPTPLTLKMKVDIWSANTEQKLQILEQILVFFNPSMEIQTNDNYVDWTSLSVLHLIDLVWTSRTVPSGVDTPIDVATLTVETPIWVSPPVRISRMGIVRQVVTSMWDSTRLDMSSLLDGDNPFSADFGASDALLTTINCMVEDFNIQVIDDVVTAFDSSVQVPDIPEYEVPTTYGHLVLWSDIISKFRSDAIVNQGRIFLTQRNNSEVTGLFTINPDNGSQLTVKWDIDTLMSNTGIDSNGILQFEPGYNAVDGVRPNSPGTFDAIIDPLVYNPKRPLKESSDQPILIGIRYMLLSDIGDESNEEGAVAWRSMSDVDLIAHENDIVEWDGESWNVIFDSKSRFETMIWLTNTYTGLQYMWNGLSWVRSFEGIYKPGKWRLEI